MPRADGKGKLGVARAKTKERFAAEYLIDLNATQAAVRAGYSEKGAKVTACRLMKDEDVRALIAAEMAKRSERTSIDADTVLKGIARIAAKAEAMLDFSAANRSFELLGKHLKLFTEKHEHGGIGGGPVQFNITNSEAEH